MNYDFDFLLFLVESGWNSCDLKESFNYIFAKNEATLRTGFSLLPNQKKQVNQLKIDI